MFSHHKTTLTLFIISALWANNRSGLAPSKSSKGYTVDIPLGSPVTSLRLYGAIGIPKVDLKGL